MIRRHNSEAEKLAGGGGGKLITISCYTDKDLNRRLGFFVIKRATISFRSMSRLALRFINVNAYCPGCPPRGTRVPHGGRNFRLMAQCHGGALLHLKCIPC